MDTSRISRLLKGLSDQKLIMPYLRRFMLPLRKQGPQLGIARLNAAGTRTHRMGNPDSQHVSTSYAERMNLTIRTSA